MRKHELFLEDAVLDDLASGMNQLEVPVSPRVFQFLFLAVLLAGLVVAGRVFAVGWIYNDFYSRRAYLNSNAINILPSERGIILDRYGKTLAKNEPGFRLVVKLSGFLKAYANPEAVLTRLEEATEASSGSFLSAVRGSDPERDDALVLSSHLEVSQALKVRELNLEGVRVEDIFERSYENGEAFAHLLGYVGVVSMEDLKKNSSLGNRDLIGKSGLESFYDSDLRGVNGEAVEHRNVKGEIMGEGGAKKAEIGNTIETTIDKDLQIFFYNRLKTSLDNIGSPGGVGIAVNPQTGEILSLVSLPSFENGRLDPSVLTDPARPLFNRAISGLYSPGSTIKPLVAVGILNEKILTPDDRIYSRGYIEIPNPYNPEEPSRFVDWKPHGWVDIRSALARSSNVYFYAAGGGLPQNERGVFEGAEFPKGLGISGLRKYWEMFGLNQKTGIDLPGEASGSLPDPETKKKDGGIWRIGDTYNVSIGQGDLLVTPVELMNYISAIANGGKFYEPFIVKKVIDGKGNAIKEKTPRIIKDLSGELGAWIKEVQNGMRDGVAKSYGTSYTLSDLPIRMAAKTGSAQTHNNRKVDALFAGYGPVDSAGGLIGPQEEQIAIFVLIQNAREGSLNSVPVAKDVLRWYYDNRLRNTN